MKNRGLVFSYIKKMQRKAGGKNRIEATKGSIQKAGKYPEVLQLKDGKNLIKILLICIEIKLREIFLDQACY